MFIAYTNFKVTSLKEKVMFIDYLETPLGLFELTATEKGLRQAIFCGQDTKAINTNSITELAKSQLVEYFSATRTRFTVPIDVQGTAFQQSVWQTLSQIGYGEVKNYGEIAELLGKPKAAQAVGGANGRNPLTIIVPCHRVIGKSGVLTGYAGGIERKQWLLKHEGVKLANVADLEPLRFKQAIKQRQAKTEFLQ